MEKINTSPGHFSFFKSRKKNKKEKVRKSKFSKKVESILQKKEVNGDFLDEETAGTLEELLDDVCIIGDKLKENPGFDNIKNYKKAVKKFMKYIVSKMVGIREHTSGVNILKRKRFTIINVIDKKLEGLAMEILNTQSNQIDILGRIDEINGMLVDMLR